jgi:hypothetical protein
MIKNSADCKFICKVKHYFLLTAVLSENRYDCLLFLEKAGSTGSSA